MFQILKGGAHMKDIDNIISTISSEINSLLGQYEILDDIAPLTLPILKDIKKTSASIISQLKKSIAASKKEFKELSTQASNMLKEHKAFKTEKLNYLKEKNKIEKENNSSLKNELNAEITKDKSLLDVERKNKLLDIEFYVTSSYQHIEMFEDEYKESTNRFSYQVQNAKQSYLDSIVSYNETLEKRINKLTKEHKLSINKFIKENTSIIKSYKLKISAIENEYNIKLEEFKHEIVSIKENRSNETINLNNQIRGLISIREQDNAKQNQALQEKKNNLIIERENKKKTLQLESQKIARDFVIGMNEYDEQFTEQRKEYEENARLLSNKHVMYLINTTKENERDLKQIYSHFDFKELPLSAKQTIRKINKHYQKIVKSHEITTNKEIKKLNIDMQITTERNNYQKKLLDLDRQYALLKLNEIDLKDNKYYQETENSFDAEHRYNLKTIISRYNKSANITRRGSSIKTIKLEALLDQTEANYQKELEIISSKIKDIELEIEYTQALNDLYLESEQKKHQKLINYLTVSSLLQIEKCKLLNNYNITTYELNVLNAKKILDYSILKIELQNQKFEAIETKKLSIEAQKLNNKVYSTNYKIQALDIELNKAYKTNEAVISFDITQSANELLYEKYRIDLKKIGILYQILINFKNSIDELMKTIINKSRANVSSQANGADIVNGLILNSFKLIKNEMIGFIEVIQADFFEITDERLRFVQEFKYEPLLLDKKKSYEAELAKYNDDKAKIINQIAETNKYIDNNKKALFNIEQAVAYTKGKKGTSDTRKKSKQEIKTLYERYLAIHKVVKNQNNQIAVLEKKKRNIDEAIRLLEINYNKQIADIKLQEQAANVGYNNMNTEIDRLTKGLKNDYHEAVITTNNQFEPNYYEYVINKCLIPINNFSTSFENAVINFKDIEKEIYDNNTSLIKLDFAKTLEQIEMEAMNEANVAKDKYNKTNGIQQKQINNSLIELAGLEKKYALLFKQAESNYENSINEILNEKKNKLKQFYIELYAIDDNLKDIEKDYNSFINDINNKYSLDINELLNDIGNRKKKIETSLNSLINANNLLIKHLPVAIKLQIQSTIEEEKKKNLALDLELEQERKLLIEKKKTTKKNLSIILASHQARINKIDFEHKKAIAKEKRLFNSSQNKIKHQ